MILRQSEEDARKDASPAGGGCCDNYPHRRIHFLHGKGRGQRRIEDGPRQRSMRRRKLRRITAYESRDAVQITDHTAVNCTAHHVERALQPSFDFLASPHPLGRFRDERQLAEGKVLFFGGTNCLDQ
jgi:hypothetical protein